MRASILPCAGLHAGPLVNIAGHRLFEELPILQAESSSADESKSTSAEIITVDKLLPRFHAELGRTPTARRPEDWDALAMFGGGLLLFVISWTIAAWERRPSLYRRPLLDGEASPRPEPPHVIYSLTRIF